MDLNIYRNIINGYIILYITQYLAFMQRLHILSLKYRKIKYLYIYK